MYNNSTIMFTIDSLCIVLTDTYNLNVRSVSTTFKNIFDTLVLHKNFYAYTLQYDEYKRIVEKLPKLRIYHNEYSPCYNSNTDKLLKDNQLRERIVKIVVGCNFIDTTLLRNINQVRLAHCYKVTDVSPLHNVHTLELSMCKNITDVSPLHNVHTLKLSMCSGITDVSSLGTVHTLKLFMCKNITDVSALSTVNTLKIDSCKGITDVSMLKSVKNLKIKDCDNLSTINIGFGSFDLIENDY